MKVERDDNGRVTVFADERIDTNAAPRFAAEMEQAVKDIRKADLFIVGGTSLTVYPAAGLVDYYRGHRLVLINKSVTPYDVSADLVIHDSIGKVFRQCVLQ